jgi:D-glycerate 3-kinase
VARVSMPDNTPTWQKAFLDQHRLDAAYLRYAQCWFEPLATSLLAHRIGASGARTGPPLLVAVNGSQGSGKTTLCAYLCAHLQAEWGVRAVALSLDDFYLTHADRRELAVSVHPLLATRGVPGTHDDDLLNTTLDALLTPSRTAAVPVPRFDKARDDRRLRSRWDKVEGRIDIVLLEGWCMGARPQAVEELTQPVNQLEREEDPDAFWRSHANNALQNDFLPLYERVDKWVMLAAPSFDCVYRWRLEQEHKLTLGALGKKAGAMSDKQVARFIQFYQRLTEHCLVTLPYEVDYLFSLGEQRDIVSSQPGYGQ